MRWLAVLLPALTNSFPIVLLSGVLFGGVFAVVASTTALVRHNLSAHHRAGGISAFTTAVCSRADRGAGDRGFIADGSAMSNADSLARGLLFSAIALAVGASLRVGKWPCRRAGLRSLRTALCRVVAYSEWPNKTVAPL